MRVAQNGPQPREAGRVVTMVPLISLAVLICVGIAVDFSGRTIAEQNLRDQASHCARTGAMQITQDAATSTIATAAANDCLAALGLSGTVTMNNAMLKVELADTYQTQLLSIIAINELPVRTSSTVTILSGY